MRLIIENVQHKANKEKKQVEKKQVEKIGGIDTSSGVKRVDKKM